MCGVRWSELVASWVSFVRVGRTGSRLVRRKGQGLRLGFGLRSGSGFGFTVGGGVSFSLGAGVDLSECW